MGFTVLIHGLLPENVLVSLNPYCDLCLSHLRTKEKRYDDDDEKTAEKTNYPFGNHHHHHYFILITGIFSISE